MSMNNQKSAKFLNQESMKLTAKEKFYRYKIALPFILFSLLFALAIAFVYIKYQNDVYSSSISVFFPEENRSGAEGADLSALSEVLLFDKKVNLANEMQIVKSKSLMTRVVKKLNLNLLYYKKGKTKLLEMYRSPLLSAQVLGVKDSLVQERLEFIKDGDELFWLEEEDKKVAIKSGDVIKGKNITAKVNLDATGLKNDDRYIVEWQPVLTYSDQLSAVLAVNQPQVGSNILTFSILTEVPEKGVEILNNLVTEYNGRTNEQKDRLVDYTLSFIDERVNLMRGELGRVEGGLQSIKQTALLTPDDQTQLGVTQLAGGTSKVDDVEMKMEMIRMVRQSASIPNQPITLLSLNDPSIGGLVQQYNSLLFQKEDALKTTPAANPMVKKMQAQIEQLRPAILSELDKLASSASNARQRFQAEVSTGRSRLVSVPGQQRKLLEVSREQEIKEKLFLFLLQRKEEAAITKASNLSMNTIPVDPASTDQLVSPDTTSIYQKALLLGLLIPIGLIYLRDLLNDKITTRTDITSRTNMPIIGEIVHSTNKRRRIVVSFDDRSVLGEQFRMIRANIPLLTKSQSKNTILITSTTSGEGKTFSSLNLAAVYAVAGKKTVMIEMDLRKPKAAEALGVPANSKGITHYISEQATLDELAIPVAEVDNLYIITAGIIPPNPSEILMDEKIGVMFDYLKQNFDFVIIDSAPLGLVSDCKILAKYADTTLYVVRQRVTAKKQLDMVNEHYENQLFSNMALLVNDVKTTGSDSYYGYGGNYMSNYKYSYGNEQKNIWQKAKAKMKEKI